MKFHVSLIIVAKQIIAKLFQIFNVLENLIKEYIKFTFVTSNIYYFSIFEDNKINKNQERFVEKNKIILQKNLRKFRDFEKFEQIIKKCLEILLFAYFFK